MRLLNRHLLRATVGPFLFGLATITFLMMIDNLFRYVDMFVSKGVPFTVATKVLILSLGFTLALSVPMSVLIAVLMSVGQLAGDNEITAMKASGISLFAILRPLLLGATIIAVGLTAFNHYIYPESNHTLVNLLHDIRRSRPMLEIRAQVFTDLSDGMTIHVATKDDRTGDVTDVSLIEKEKPGELGPRVTTAKTGRITSDRATGAITLELFDGEIHELPDPEQPEKYQVTRFGRQIIVLQDQYQGIQDSGRQTRGDREMNLTDLKEAARSQQRQLLDSRQHIVNVNADVVQSQYRLLNPARRGLSADAAPARPAELSAQLGATRRKLDHAASQARAQVTVADSHIRRSNKFMVEYHKKLAIPVACLVFTVVGIPLAVTTSRSGKGVSVSLAMAIYVFYYLCLVGGEKLSDRGFLDPALAMWAGNILLLLVGVPLFWRAVRETTYVRLRRPRWRGHRPHEVSP
jgi:lipopolysaccharide export system permease protein